MRRLALLLLVSLTVACGPLVEGGQPDVISAHVVDVLASGDHGADSSGAPRLFQRLRLQLDESLYRGELVELEWAGQRSLDPNGFLHPGDRVLLSVTRSGNDRSYSILEVVRLPVLIPMAALLVIALLIVARLRGLVALAGLASSVAVVLLAIVPSLQRGNDPLFATLVGSLGVIAVSVLLVHGFHRRSLAAMCGAMAGLGVVTAVGALALATARMTGIGTEDQVLLVAGTSGRIDMPRLALAAVMVGSLGAIVDLCVGQATAVSELAWSDGEVRGRRLYESAVQRGRAHVGSLMNTLGLAYFGGVLPLVVLISFGYQPLPVAMNGEEIVASLVAIMAASIGLVLCVPITTVIAVLFAGSSPPPPHD